MFLVCGEALFDLFLESEEGPASALYAARAGGSPFNVAIGLARLGERAGLLTGLSTDLLGQRLSAVLAAEGVSTAYAIATDRPTTISLVGLDTAGVPAYQFYKNGSADTGVAPADLPVLGPEVTGLHFGSYSLAAAPVADAFAALAATAARPLRLARPQRAADGRARHGRLARAARRCSTRSPPSSRSAPRTSRCSTRAPARRASPPTWSARASASSSSPTAATRREGWTATGHHATAMPPKVTVIDTVGAGDTFQAALIARLLRAAGGPKAGLAALDADSLRGLLAYAARAAAITCSRRGADLPRLAELTD